MSFADKYNVHAWNGKEKERHSKTFVLYHCNSSVDDSRYVFIATRKWERISAFRFIPTARKICSALRVWESGEKKNKMKKRYKSYSFLFHNAARAQASAFKPSIIESLYLLYELTHFVSTVRARIILHGRR